MPIGRRQFGLVAGGAFISYACDTFGVGHDVGRRSSDASTDGRLAARPGKDVKTTVDGRRALGIGRGRDAILQLPSKANGALPLIVLLHGAGGAGEGILRRLGAAAEEAGVAVLAPDSRGSTWDAIRGGFDDDVAFIDRALKRVFELVAVDSDRIGVGGFSDGATYALSLGLINGDLFRHIVAFSPGFIAGGEPHGPRPRVFISHGTADQILPIDQCSRQIVPALRRRGYDVTYREFEGRHEVPADVAREGLSVLVNPGSAAPV